MSRFSFAGGVVLLVLAASVPGLAQVPGTAAPKKLVLDDEVGADAETMHVRVQAESPGRVGADGRVTLSLHVTPKPKMHVYAADVQGYVPFTMRVDADPALAPGKTTYPPAETYVFPPTGESSRVYEKPFVVSQSVTLTPAARRTLAAGGTVDAFASVRYQACDDTLCYRPATARVRWRIGG